MTRIISALYFLASISGHAYAFSFRSVIASFATHSECERARQEKLKEDPNRPLSMCAMPRNWLGGPNVCNPICARRRAGHQWSYL